MNLIKSFNFKFFKENIKKSKGAIALLVLVVPVFTALVTVLCLNEYNVNVPSKEYFSLINFIGMYFIPVLMSSALFGYVYKKKSVDFINSQPINRKTIFITNTIGGIALITLIQLLSAVVVLVCGALLPNIIIFPQMILDIFIMMWSSYVFVFLATNVAMSVSGTFCTQIVVTMLILFLVPFCYDSFKDYNYGTNFELVNGENKYNKYFSQDEYYTMPYQLFHSIFSYHTSEFDFFSYKSISRMAILGIIYYFAGLYLFKNRKMENNEESFSNEKVHIFVKALTILPMLIMLNIMEAEKEFNIIVVAVIITYYFVYDFIVKRKLKLKNSLIYLVLIMAVLQGCCSIAEIVKDIERPLKQINVENISSIKFQSIFSNDKSRYSNIYSVKLGEYIENKEFIKLLFDTEYKYGYRQNESAEVINAEISNDEVVDTVYKDEGVCELTIKMKNGKLYTTQITLDKTRIDNIIEELSKNEKFVDNVKKSLTKDTVCVLNRFMIITGEEKKIIQKEIENEVNNMSIIEILSQRDVYGENASINKYYYKNNRLQGISIPSNITDEVLKIASKHINKASVEKIKSNLDRNYNYEIYDESKNFIDNDESKVYLDYVSEDITKFIIANENETFDVTKPYCVINLNGIDNLQFYTNKVEEIQGIIAKAKEYEKSLDTEVYEDITTIY